MYFIDLSGEQQNKKYHTLQNTLRECTNNIFFFSIIIFGLSKIFMVYIFQTSRGPRIWNLMKTYSKHLKMAFLHSEYGILFHHITRLTYVTWKASKSLRLLSCDCAGNANAGGNINLYIQSTIISIFFFLFFVLFFCDIVNEQAVFGPTTPSAHHECLAATSGSTFTGSSC